MWSGRWAQGRAAARASRGDGVDWAWQLLLHDSLTQICIVVPEPFFKDGVQSQPRQRQPVTRRQLAQPWGAPEQGRGWVQASADVRGSPSSVTFRNSAARRVRGLQFSCLLPYQAVSFSVARMGSCVPAFRLLAQFRDVYWVNRWMSKWTDEWNQSTSLPSGANERLREGSPQRPLHPPSPPYPTPSCPLHPAPPTSSTLWHLLAQRNTVQKKQFFLLKRH